jgi:putative ABC transport system permease protein
MALGVCLIVVSFAMLDSTDDAIVTFFEEIDIHDVSASFATEQPGRVVSQIGGWPGVRRVEPSLDVAIDLERDGISHSTILSGILADSRIRRLTYESGRQAVPERGEVLLGAMLRKKLGVEEGDLVTLSYAQNRRDFRTVRTARVGPVIAQPIGSTAYMGMDDVHDLFSDRLGMPAGAATGALLLVDPERTRQIASRLDRMPSVAAVQTRVQAYEQVQELMRFTIAFTGVMAFFGVGLAFAVVFTAVSINILERVRELATLRTMGFGLRHITVLSTVENFAVAAAGLLIGLPAGRWLDIYLMSTFESESMSLEPVIYPRTYLIAVASAFVLTALSQIPSLLHVRRMDLAAATKEMGG